MVGFTLLRHDTLSLKIVVMRTRDLFLFPQFICYRFMHYLVHCFDWLSCANTESNNCIFKGYILLLLLFIAYIDAYCTCSGLCNAFTDQRHKERQVSNAWLQQILSTCITPLLWCRGKLYPTIDPGFRLISFQELQCQDWSCSREIRGGQILFNISTNHESKFFSTLSFSNSRAKPFYNLNNMH